MSTRCQLFITEDNKPVATIYRHYDGYPEGMGVFLANALDDGSGDLVIDVTAFIHKLLDFTDTYNVHLEFEGIESLHGDTEFEYHINFSGWNKTDFSFICRDLWNGGLFIGSDLKEIKEAMKAGKTDNQSRFTKNILKMHQMLNKKNIIEAVNLLDSIEQHSYQGADNGEDQQ